MVLQIKTLSRNEESDIEVGKHAAGHKPQPCQFLSLRGKPYESEPADDRVVHDIHSVFEFHELETGAHRGMLDFLYRLRFLALVVADQMLEPMIGRQVAAGDIAILVDRAREHRTTVLAVPDRVVGAAAEK